MKKYCIYLLFLMPLYKNYATVVIQDNGDVVTGSVKEDRGDTILFLSKYGNLVIEKIKIKKLIQDESTIKPETIEYRGKHIEVRLLFEDADQKVFITSKGQIIRILFKELQQKEKEKTLSEQKIKKSRLGVYGSIGLINQPYPVLTSADIQWAYDMTVKIPGFEISYIFYPIPALGFGLEFTKYFYNLPYQYTISDIDVTNNIVNDFYGLNFIAEFSLMGALGFTKSVHDVGVGATAGLSLVHSSLTIESDLFSKISASGENLHFNGGAYLYYLLKINSFMALFAKAQYRFFAYRQVYQQGQFSAAERKSETINALAKLNELAVTEFETPHGWAFDIGARLIF